LNRLLKNVAVALTAVGTIFGVAHAQDKAKVYLALSYIGDDWTAQATSTVRAMALSDGMKDKVDLEIQVAGPNAQKQIQQINAMVQAGAKAIVVYPISPTALNQVVKNACEKGVKIFTFDAEISEPCAHNVHIDQKLAGTKAAEWLATTLGGKGNIVYLSGVPGTTTDTLRTEGSMEVLAKYPDIKIVSQVPAMWSQAVTRTEMSKILATRDWKDIDGVLGQAGCFAIFSMQDEAGIADADKKPCAGEGENGQRIQMLPLDAAVDGANGTYRPMGVKGFSYASPPVSAAYALKLAVQAIEGSDVPHDIIVPLPQVTSEKVKLCMEGTFEEMKGGCNAFQPSIVPNPGWFAEIYMPETPEIGLVSALTGQPEN
jgi:ribose transport system substrate-binding protein